MVKRKSRPRSKPKMSESAGPLSPLQVRELSESLVEIGEGFGLNQADWELAMEDRGWLTFPHSQLGSELMGRRRTQMIARCRLFWRTDPLAKQAVRLWTDYGIGKGISYEVEDDETSQTALDKFFKHRKNKKLTCSKGQQRLSKKLLIDGDIFFAIFDGDPKVLRTIEPLQIKEIITDPDDEEEVLCYKRQIVGSVGDATPRTLYYKDWAAEDSDLDGLKDPEGQSTITVEKKVVIYHLSFDDIGKWGNGLLSPVVEWSNAHRMFMEDRVAITRGLAKFVTKLTVKGGQSAVDAMRKKLESSLTQTGYLGGYEKHPTNAPGSTWLQNAGVDMQAAPRASGAGDAMSDGRMLKLQVCAGTGIMEHYFGDGANANLAIACYSEDTEYLSEQGWKHYGEFDGEKIAAYDGVTGCLRYEVPRALHVYPYRGQMTHFHGRGTDCLVTPNHRMWTRLTPTNVSPAEYAEWKNNEPFKFLCADGLSNQGQRFNFANRSTIETVEGVDNLILGDHQWDSTMAARFLGLFLSEGSTYLQKSRNYAIEFAQNEESAFCGEIDALFAELFETLGRKSPSHGLNRWLFSDVALYEWLREHCGTGAGSKRFPEVVWSLPLAAKTELFNWLMKGDGHRDARSLNCKSGFYSTSSVPLLNDFQRLCCEIGVSCHTRLARQKPGCLPEYIAQVRFDCESVELDPDRNSSELAYEGDVWCFETSTGIFVTRRNGKVSYQGNTAMEMPMLKQFMGYQELWMDVWQDIFSLVLDEDIDADPITINVTLPKILQEDLVKLGQYLTALTSIFPEAKVEDILRLGLEDLGLDDIDEVLKAAAAQREKIDAENAANVKLEQANAAAKAAPAPVATSPVPALSKESIDALEHFSRSADSLKEVIET